ncbi:MAG: diguanylate cyclase (GGDEF)-like protein [Planctomycetota bacterium]
MLNSLLKTFGKTQLGLAARTALVASILSVSFVTLVGGISYFTARTQITQGIESGIANNASLISGRLSSTLSSVVITLSELKGNDLILNSLMDSHTRDTSLEPFLADFSSINGVPVEIALTDFEGKAIAGQRSVIGASPEWLTPVLEAAVSHASILNVSNRVYILIAEPVLFLRTNSAEGALVHRIDITQLLKDINNSGSTHWFTLLQGDEPILAGELADNPYGDTSQKITSRRLLELPAIFSGLKLALEISTSAKLVKEPLRSLTLIYSVLGIALIAIVIFLSIVAANHLAQPLSDLERVAARIVDSGSYDHRFDEEGYSEVLRLGQTFNRMLESLGDAHAQVSKLANHDVLTGLANRALFYKNMARDLHYVQRSEGSLAVLLLDVDKFKDINDTLGHPVGDELLKQVAFRLNELVRNTDTVARLGGDEFAIIATQLNDDNDSSVLGQKIIKSMAIPFQISSQEVHVSASIGIAIFREDGTNPDQLLRNADLALYKAKEEGRANFQFFNKGLNASAQKRKRVEKSIRQALKQSEFCLHYQPKVDLASGMIAGVEALVRWQSIDRLVYPDHFIPVVEASNLIIPLGEWVLREACRQKIIWDKSELPPFSVAVNVSAVQLRQQKHVSRLLSIIKESGVNPAGLQIEITESTLMEKADIIADRFELFRDLGISLAIDDIGTGYSSLSNLKRLPVDVLKIDRSFVQDLEVDKDDAAITKAIIQLGLSLDLTVVAEGVETSGQLKFLYEHGCHQSQGYIHSQPLAAPALADWINNTDFSMGKFGGTGRDRPRIEIVGS